MVTIEHSRMCEARNDRKQSVQRSYDNAGPLMESLLDIINSSPSLFPSAGQSDRWIGKLLESDEPGNIRVLDGCNGHDTFIKYGINCLIREQDLGAGLQP
jgi:hypothetical protein